jgi:DNA-binding protein H-NS
MAKTYIQLQDQIAQLQRAADALMAKEAAEVVARIKLAIAHYGLTPDDLFGQAAAKTPQAPRAPKALKAAKAAKAPPAQMAKPAKPAKTVKKAPTPPKYRDEAGNAWTGNGKRPRWFLAAMANGKTPKDLEINPVAA